jgi:hypothetical protein
MPMPMGSPQQQGGWWWDGSNWVCDPDCGSGSPWPCPPPSFPPPGCPPWFPPPQGQPPWYPGANAGVSFSAVAPPNPIRGNFWWDGKTLWMFDGAMWVAVGGTIVPQLGVTDGSNAPAGHIGEVVHLTATWPVPTTSQVNYPLPIGTLPAGDWDCWVQASAGVFVTNLQTNLSPVPVGFSGNMGALIANVSGVLEAVTLTGPYARASLSAPAALSFAMTTNNVGAGPSAGTGTLIFDARRAR